MTAEPQRDDVTAVPRWAAVTIYAGAGVFGLLNLVLSSLSIGNLALDHLHLDLLRAVALGLTPDAGALVAGTLWVACTGHLRRWGRNVSLGLVGGSVVGNAADILASAGLLDARVLVPLAVTLGVSAPVLALVMGHLVLLVQAATAGSRDATRTDAVTRETAPRRKAPAARDVPPQLPPVAEAVTVADVVDETPEERTKRLAAERSRRYRENQKKATAAPAAA